MVASLLACLMLQAAPSSNRPTALVAATGVGAEQQTGERELSILAWPGYIERGESDPKYDWVTAFEKSTGCAVKVSTAATSDEMVQKTKSKGFDLVTASGDASVRLIKAKRVQAIDVSRVPSYRTIDSRLQSSAWHTSEGLHYGVPYQWGPNVLMFNTAVFKSPPDSWSVVFEQQALPDGKPNTGRVQAYDGPIYIADAALYLMAKKPELGIKDPYELSPLQYREVLKLLKGQRKLVGKYWHDTTAQVDEFRRGQVIATGGWGYQVNTLKAEKQPVDAVVPSEGSTGWADTTMMLVDAAHPNCAYQWLEWSLSRQVQASVAEWFGSLPVVPEACKTRAPGFTDFCKVNGFDRFERIHFWRTPELKCESQKSCVPYATWATDYSAIKSKR